jgi:rubrerythrin
MELDGEQYYNEQAMINKNNPLFPVFKLLAQEERIHANILEQYSVQAEYDLTESEAYSRFKNVFANMDEFSVEIKSSPEQIDAYRLALEKERASIELYEKMQNDAKSDQDKTLFAFLVEQEKIHYRIFDDIIQHLIKAEQWVEDAEFGVREEY